MGENKDATGAESLAEKFAKAVVRKNVNGFLPEGSKINGVKIHGIDAGGFYDHGPDKLYPPRGEKNVARLHNHSIYPHRVKLPDLVQSHIVSVAQSDTDRGNMVLTIHFFNDSEKLDPRSECSPAYITTELPERTMTEFLEEISRNPDLLEDFYQKAFVGLDSVGGLPGMKRVKADGFFLISGDKLIEAGKIESHLDIDGVRNFFETLEKHHYQNGPYGTSEFRPRIF